MSQFEVNTPSVVGEVIDGEAVIMDLKAGNYYSIQGVGAAIWSYIEAGCSSRAIEQALAGCFPESAASISDDLAGLLAHMHRNNLIRPSVDGTESQMPDLAQMDAISSYSKPEMQSYTDMKDLLLLDPVHEVDEAGWPDLEK